MGVTPIANRLLSMALMVSSKSMSEAEELGLGLDRETRIIEGSEPSEDESGRSTVERVGTEAEMEAETKAGECGEVEEGSVECRSLGGEGGGEWALRGDIVAVKDFGAKH